MAITDMRHVAEGSTVIFVLKTGERFKAWVGCSDAANGMFWIDKHGKGDGCNEPLEYSQIQHVLRRG